MGMELMETYQTLVFVEHRWLWLFPCSCEHDQMFLMMLFLLWIIILD